MSVEHMTGSGVLLLRIVEAISLDYPDGLVVGLSVVLMPFKIFIAVFDGSDAEHNKERQTSQGRGDLREPRKELENDENWGREMTKSGILWANKQRRCEPKKKMFATLRNCSSRFLGRKVMRVYLDVLTYITKHTSEPYCGASVLATCLVTWEFPA